jgi:hypothetical protein
LADQAAALDTEHRADGQIRLRDDGVLIDRQIPDGREIVQVPELLTRLLELRLRSSQLFVLQLQLNLVNLEFMHHPREVFLACRVEIPVTRLPLRFCAVAQAFAASNLFQVGSS